MGSSYRGGAVAAHVAVTEVVRVNQDHSAGRIRISDRLKEQRGDREQNSFTLNPESTIHVSQIRAIVLEAQS
jgi:hypothetical protein